MSEGDKLLQENRTVVRTFELLSNYFVTCFDRYDCSCSYYFIGYESYSNLTISGFLE